MPTRDVINERSASGDVLVDGSPVTCARSSRCDGVLVAQRRELLSERQETRDPRALASLLRPVDLRLGLRLGFGRRLLANLAFLDDRLRLGLGLRRSSRTTGGGGGGALRSSTSRAMRCGTSGTCVGSGVGHRQNAITSASDDDRAERDPRGLAELLVLIGARRPRKLVDSVEDGCGAASP